MNAFNVALLLSFLSFSFSFIAWIVIISVLKVRITEPYLSGEPEKEFKLVGLEPSINFVKILRRLYNSIYHYIQTGYWGDWFSFSLLYLLLLITMLALVYLFRGE